MGNTVAGEGDAVASGGVALFSIPDEDGVTAQAVRDKSIIIESINAEIFVFIKVYRSFLYIKVTLSLFTQM